MWPEPPSLREADTHNLHLDIFICPSEISSGSFTYSTSRNWYMGSQGLKYELSVSPGRGTQQSP